MFTGIIEELGSVVSFDAKPVGARMVVSCRAVLDDLRLGSSVAVNGACLTAVEIDKDKWSADIAPETLTRTNLNDLGTGSVVNLERPMRVNSRLDGHFVLGHVDGTAEIVSLDLLGDENWWLRIRVPDRMSRYIVEKGSLAVDGISLTVAAVSQDTVEFTVIPHTYQSTTLHARHKGSRVNVEVDILAKHLEKLAGQHLT